MLFYIRNEFLDCFDLEMHVLGDRGFHPSLILGPWIINKANTERVKSASVGILPSERLWKQPAWVQT